MNSLRMGMTPMKIAAFSAHATQAQYRRRLAALQETAASLDPARTYVSFSAGKDSAVIAHACHAAHPGIAILMVDPGCPTHWTEAERDAWLEYAAAQGWNLRMFPWDKWGPGFPIGGDLGAYRRTIHHDMFHDLHRWAEDHRLTCRVMGIRAEESRARRIMIASRGDEYAYRDRTTAVLPIARWSVADVWAYIVTAGLPWLSIYDYLGPEARNGLVGRNGERFGRAEYLKHHYPDVWRWAMARGIF